MPFFRRSHSSFYSGLRTGPNPVIKPAEPGDPLPDFPNGNFEEDFKYWTLFKQHVSPGGVVSGALSTALGCALPPDPSPNPRGFANKNSTLPPGPFVSYGQSPELMFNAFGRVFESVVGYGGPNGKYAILRSGKGLASNPFGGVVYGPMMISENPVIAEVGDRVTFNWKATANGDAYKILAYLLNKDTCKFINLIDAVGNAESSATPWAPVYRTIQSGEAGNYYFVFICGSFDYSAGGILGSELYVDEIKLQKAGTY